MRLQWIWLGQLWFRWICYIISPNRCHFLIISCFVRSSSEHMIAPILMWLQFSSIHILTLDFSFCRKYSTEWSAHSRIGDALLRDFHKIQQKILSINLTALVEPFERVHSIWMQWKNYGENGSCDGKMVIFFFLGANSMRWSLPEGLFETGYETHTKDSLARAKSLGVICYYCVWVIGCAKRRCTYAMCGIWTEEITSAGDVMKEKYKWNRLDVVDVLDLRYARRAKHIHITNHESRHLNICPCVDGINESWLY